MYFSSPSSGSIVGIRTIVISEYRIISSITKESSSETTNRIGSQYPTRGFLIDNFYGLQESIIFFRQ